MKCLIWILFCFSSWVYADSDVCGQYVKQDQRMMRAIHFLQRYQGAYTLGQCQVELHICSRFSEENDRGEQVGDLLVVDSKHREYYIPLYFFTQASDRFYSMIMNGRIMFHYMYADKLPNARGGNYEAIHLEILSKWDSRELNRIEVGYGARGHFNWTICQKP